MHVLSSADVSPVAPDSEILARVGAVSESLLRDIVQALSFPRSFLCEPLNNRRAAEWIFERLRSYGYQPGYQSDHANIVVCPPHPTKEAVILIGAHYDTVPGTPGADDNASAVAAMLGCAKIVAESVEHPPLCVVAFNREEESMIGSTDFVKRYLPERSLCIGEAHILEMVGYCTQTQGSQRKPLSLPVSIPETGNFLGLIGNKHSNTILTSLVRRARSYFPDLPVTGLQVFYGAEKFFYHLLRSDHVPFWRRGLSALMWTDTANFRNPHYHSPTDTPDTLDYAFLRRVTQLLALQTLLFIRRYRR